MVLVVIPAYNEKLRVGRVIRGLFEHGYKDVLVVDDGSKDDTALEAEKAGAKVIKHEINRGQGAALETGDAYARNVGAEIVIHFDADGQFNPLDIEPALKLMRDKNVDLVFGSRFLDSRSKIPWQKKYLILPAARWINFVFTGITLSDAHNGFRILSKKALSKVVFLHDRMAHNTEILKIVKKNNLTYAESPVEVTYLNYGQGLSGGFRIILDLIIASFTK
ncbi:MAG: glycosyltransferase family 2 protein [Candidatus Magasanikbacteria bacterium]|jgi:glycosyltransferase involved in cell wall biosynthesis